MSQADKRAMSLESFRERVDQGVALPDSEEGQDEIHNNGRTHVTVMWEDGEINTTKAGDLYGRRTMHLTGTPLMENVPLLWDVPEGKDHQKKIVTDPEVKDMVQRAELNVEVEI